MEKLRGYYRDKTTADTRAHPHVRPRPGYAVDWANRVILVKVAPKTTLAAFSSSDWLVAAFPACRKFVGKANIRAQIARGLHSTDMPMWLDGLA